MKVVASVVLVLGLISFFCNKKLNDAYFLRIIHESKEYLKSVQMYNAYRFDVNGKPKYIEASSNNLRDQTFLVIIGESQN
uniref:hypothetical protein n=1 Tax=Phascolarctobacterium succinatutens TaxID=626940 RepID=UPI003FD8AD05